LRVAGQPATLLVLGRTRRSGRRDSKEERDERLDPTSAGESFRIAYTRYGYRLSTA